MRLVAVLAALGVIVLGVGLAAPHDLQRRAEAALAVGPYEASIGSLEIRWFQAAVELFDVEVVDPADGTRVIEVPYGAGDLAVGALFRGNLVVRDVYLQDATFDLTGDEGRREAWMQALQRESEDAPAYVIEQVRVRSSRARLAPEGLAQVVELEPFEATLHDVRNRPAPEGVLPTQLFATATVPPGGALRIGMQLDMGSERASFDLSVDGEALPVELASPRVEEAVGLEVTGGEASVELAAVMRGGDFQGEVQASAEDVELSGEALPEIAAEAAEAGVSVAEQVGLLDQASDFSGAVPEETSLGRAITSTIREAFESLVPVG